MEIEHEDLADIIAKEGIPGPKELGKAVARAMREKRKTKLPGDELFEEESMLFDDVLDEDPEKI